jgi:hypothetical protein
MRPAGRLILAGWGSPLWLNARTRAAEDRGVRCFVGADSETPGDDLDNERTEQRNGQNARQREPSLGSGQDAWWVHLSVLSSAA